MTMPTPTIFATSRVDAKKSEKQLDQERTSLIQKLEKATTKKRTQTNQVSQNLPKPQSMSEDRLTHNPFKNHEVLQTFLENAAKRETEFDQVKVES